MDGTKNSNPECGKANKVQEVYTHTHTHTETRDYSDEQSRAEFRSVYTHDAAVSIYIMRKSTGAICRRLAQSNSGNRVPYKYIPSGYKNLKKNITYEKKNCSKL